MKNSYIADGVLLLVAMTWGLNFVFTKNALSNITPFMYLGIRFVIAAFFMAIFFHRKLLRISKDDVKGGLVIGLLLSLGFITQTVGLVYTTPSKSGFITGINVVLVPFFAYFVTKKFPGVFQLAGAVITFIGLGFISINENLSVNIGDILTFACAICFALQIAFTEHYVKKGNPINIAFIQIALNGIITTLMALIFEPLPGVLHPDTINAILFGAAVCTAGAFAIQNTAQRYTSSSHVAVIMCTESVFAGVFSYFMWGEPITTQMIIGFAFILVGILVTELLPLRPKERNKGHLDINTVQ